MRRLVFNVTFLSSISISALLPLDGCDDTYGDQQLNDTDDGLDDPFEVPLIRSALSTTYPDGLSYCGDGSLGTQVGRLYRKSGAVYTQIAACGFGCGVNQAGVSDECIPPGPFKSDVLSARAMSAAGPAKASIYGAVPAPTWLTDVSGNDGQNIRDAVALYASWRRTNPTVGAGAQPPSDVRANMIAKVAAFATTASDRNALVDRIIAVYAGTVPTTQQATLDLLGIRAQCKETVDRLVREAGLTSRTYASYLANGWVKFLSRVRPGNIAIRRESQHAAIVIAVKRDAIGNLLSITLAESNWGATYSSPVGQIPWQRVITTTREVPRSLINVGVGGDYKIVELKD